MFSFHRKPISNKKLTRQIFGECAKFQEKQECLTLFLTPELQGFGKYVVLENVVEATVRGHRFRYAASVKVYQSKWSKRANSCAFRGSALWLPADFGAPHTYAYTGLPFSVPAPADGWRGNDELAKFDGLRVYTRGPEPADIELIHLTRLFEWVAGGLGTTLSSQYAIHCNRDSRAIYFNKPAPCSFEDAAKAVKDVIWLCP